MFQVLKCYIFARLPLFSWCECPDMKGCHFLGIIPQLAAFELISRYDIIYVIENFMEYNSIFFILNLDSTE